LQLELRLEDLTAYKVLWIKDVEQPLESELLTLQLNRLTFGIACTLLLLAATIQKHLLKIKSDFPVVNQLLHGFWRRLPDGVWSRGLHANHIKLVDWSFLALSPANPE
jgi:hypothetical protein